MKRLKRLAAIARSRTEAARRVERAQMLLSYRENPSFFAVGQRLGAHHQTVQRCVERALAYGPLAALDDRPRPGKEPTITPEAKAWLVSLAWWLPDATLESAAGLAGIINRETKHWTDAARAAELGLPQVARAAWTLGRTKRVRMDYAAGAADGAA
jgi:transposase